MALTTLCRLCVNNSSSYKTLHDDQDQFNRIYDTTVKYFDPLLLEFTEDDAPSVICVRCWQHIETFHKFQQSVMGTNHYKSSIILCRLCVTTASNSLKNLLDNNCQYNGVYDMTVKYFDAMLFQPIEGNSQNSPSCAICAKCYQHIEDFHTFQQSIINNHYKLMYIKPTIFINKLEDHLKMDEIQDIDNQDKLDIVEETFYIEKFLSKKKRCDNQTHEETMIELKPSTKKIIQNYLNQRKSGNEDNIYNKSVPNLECVECHATFDTYNLLNKHFWDTHPGKEFFIICCKQKFNKRCKLLEHLQSSIHKRTDIAIKQTNNISAVKRPHLKKPTWVCQHCNRTFKYRLSFEKHTKIFHSNESLQDLDPRDDEPNEDLPIIHIKNKQLPKIESSHRFDKKSYHIADFAIKEVTENDSLSPFMHTRYEAPKTTLDIQDIHTEVPCKLDPLSDDEISEFYPEVTVYPQRIPNNIDNNLTKVKSQTHSYIKQEIVNESTNYSNHESYFIVPDIPNNSPEIHMPPLDIKPEFAYSSDDNDSDTPSHQDQIDANLSIKSKPINSESHQDKIDANLSIQQSKPIRKSIDLDELIAKWLPQLFCRICNAEFPYYSLIREHFYHEHSQQKYYITCCERNFWKGYEIRQHIRTHLNPDALTCKICNKLFARKASLKVHMSEMHNIKLASSSKNVTKCDISKKHGPHNEQDSTSNGNSNNESTTIQNQKTIDNDEIIARWIPQLECRICKENFPYYRLMRAHFYREHPLEKCNVVCCQRNFCKGPEVAEHVRKHLDPNAFACKICHRQLAGKSSLIRHMRDKHDETVAELECPENGLSSKSTKRKKNNKQKFLEHDEIIAKWMPQLECRICKATFPYYRLMRAHFSSEHPQEKCIINCCHRKFCNLWAAVEHIRVHLDLYAFKCEICNKPFARKCSLIRHKREKHEKVKLKTTSTVQ